ncbi:hypothetical protein NBRC111894_2953 [Sporolactobacillus inulinus]|uniref:Uncharacterized protein n=1 Tax=Sporolactobacillus inulinus TaxID=2078 RepID=A0A4Y1ZEH5_9BACL|nr:hypothetical protein NBRC111894_2953 [Sporolactobacillus inulinus]
MIVRLLVLVWIFLLVVHLDVKMAVVKTETIDLNFIVKGWSRECRDFLVNSLVQ